MSEELIKRLRNKANRQWRQVHDDTADLLREAADSLEALSRPAPVQVSLASQSVPKGWKLVPVEPTPKMLESIANTVPCMTSDARLGYRAMLAAAPSAPAAPSVDAEKVMALVEEVASHLVSAQYHSIRNDREYWRAETKLADEAKAQIRALLTPASVAHGWIPVGDRRPGVGVVVLGFWKNSAGPHSHITGQNYGITARNEHGLWYDASEDDNEDDEWIRPDYWQHLPPPPAIANQEAQDGR